MRKLVTTWKHVPKTAAADRRAALERLAALGAAPKELAKAEVSKFEHGGVSHRRMIVVRK